MEKKLDTIKLNSFNCRGLRNRQKRLNVFLWLKKYHSGITLLQETHATNDDEKEWVKDWEGQIVFSHGTSTSRGVAILIPSNLQMSFNIITTFRDLTGRILLIECNIETNRYVIVNIYAPTKDMQKKQLDFLNDLKDALDNFSDKTLIIGGDFNTCLDPYVDKKGGKLENKSLYSDHILGLMEEMSLIDIW